MAVNFFLKDPSGEGSLIYCIVRYAGQRYKFSTKETIPVKAWNKTSQQCREIREFKLAALVNERLRTLRIVTEKVVEDFKSRFEVPSDTDFKAAVKVELDLATGRSQDNGIPLFTDWIDDHIRGSQKKQRTRISYQTTLNKLIEYEGYIRKRLRFEDIDIDFYNDFRRWVYSKDYKKNYFGSLVKNIKVFMEESSQLHGSTAHRQRKFIVESERIVSIFLSEGELVRMHRMEITEESVRELEPKIYSQRLRLRIASLLDARDRFLLGAFTGLRFSDYGKIDFIDPSQDTIQVWTIKTDQRVVIPMHWVVRDILTRRGGFLPRPVSNQKLNKQLKLLGQLAKIKDVIEVSSTVAGKRTVEKKPKYELITTHTARRSAATNMYLAGIDTLSIMMITGHRTEKAFLLYIGVTPEQNAQRLREHRFFQGKE